MTRNPLYGVFTKYDWNHEQRGGWMSDTVSQKIPTAKSIAYTEHCNAIIILCSGMSHRSSFYAMDKYSRIGDTKVTDWVLIIIFSTVLVEKLFAVFVFAGFSCSMFEC